MILIHQVKSGGSSLKYGLCRDLSMTEYVAPENRPTVTARNSSTSKVIRDLRPFAKDKKIIRGVHLHPTLEVLTAFESEGIKAVVLLRNPYDSFEAAKRHRTTDNQVKRAHQLYRRSGEDALEQLIEFNQNWRTLVGSEQLLFISFDQVVESYPEVVEKIGNFYEIPIQETEMTLPKVRYTGVGGGSKTDLSATTEPTNRFSSYNKRKAFARYFFERAPLFFNLCRTSRRLRRLLRK